MKKQLYSIIILLAVIFIAGCDKQETILSASGSGTFTAKFSGYDAATQKRSTDEVITATSVLTTKVGNNYTIVAKDAKNNVLTIIALAVTGIGSFKATGTFLKSGKTYTSTNSNLTITAFSNTNLTGTFLVESAEWALYNGNLVANF